MGLSRRKFTRECKLAAGISPTAGDGVSGRARVVFGQNGWSARSDTRWRSIFELVFAAHRGVAETADTGWKAAVSRRSKS